MTTTNILFVSFLEIAIRGFCEKLNHKTAFWNQVDQWILRNKWILDEWNIFNSTSILVRMQNRMLINSISNYLKERKTD